MIGGLTQLRGFSFFLLQKAAQRSRAVIDILTVRTDRKGPRMLRVAASDRGYLWGQDALPTATREWRKSGLAQWRGEAMQDAEVKDMVDWNLEIPTMFGDNGPEGLTKARAFLLALKPGTDFAAAARVSRGVRVEEVETTEEMEEEKVDETKAKRRRVER